MGACRHIADMERRNTTLRRTAALGHADVYLVLLLTLLIILPWTTLRKVPITCNVVSGSVAILHFPQSAAVQPGLFGRIARTPLGDYHAFALVSWGSQPLTGSCTSHSSHNAQTGNYMVIVGQGDFTRDLITHPPTHLWTRTFNFAGVPYMTGVYRRGLYVVTGSAIAVALSVFLQPAYRKGWYLLWISSCVIQRLCLPCGMLNETPVI